MKRITDIKELKRGDKIVRIDSDGCGFYEFLMIHPHNDQYVLMIEEMSQNAPKFYIPILTDPQGKWFMDYTFEEIYDRRIAYLKRQIELLEKQKGEMIRKEQKRNQKSL